MTRLFSESFPLLLWQDERIHGKKDRSHYGLDGWHQLLQRTGDRTTRGPRDHRRDLEDHVERWTLAAHDDDRIVPHSVEERCSSLGRHFVHLMDDEYKHLNTLREHGGFHKALLEGRTLEHFHVYTKEGDASQFSVPPHVDNGAFLLLTKALDVPGTERSRFVLEDARGEMISPESSDDSVLLLMGDSMRRFLGADIQVLRHAMRKVGSGMRAECTSFPTRCTMTSARQQPSQQLWRRVVQCRSV